MTHKEQVAVAFPDALSLKVCAAKGTLSLNDLFSKKPS